MDTQAVRILVRAKLRDGRLPVYKISRLLAGPGKGETCNACDTLITKEQLGKEGIVVGDGGRPLQVYAGCFQIWNAERRTRSRQWTA